MENHASSLYEKLGFTITGKTTKHHVMETAARTKGGLSIRSAVAPESVEEDADERHKHEGSSVNDLGDHTLTANRASNTIRSLISRAMWGDSMAEKEALTEFRPLIAEDWGKLEHLFGKRGAVGGCWCMWWRQTQAEFQRGRGEQNRLAFRSLVESGTVPGLLAYRNNEPAGWCAIQPRESYPRLERSKTFARVDDRSVWSITCFYIARHYRGEGLMRGLLSAAIDWAAKNGASIIEAYPFEPKEGKNISAAYTGLVPVFQSIGFVEVARRSVSRPIMRRYLTSSSPASRRQSERR